MGCLKIKSLWLVCTYRAKLIITCKGRKKKTKQTSNLVAVCFGEKSPGGRKGKRGAGSNVLLAVWRPVAGYCVRRDEDVERQRDGFKAWQQLLGFSTAVMRSLGFLIFITQGRLN